MNTVSLVGSISRRAGGLFESVRRLHQELLASECRAPLRSAFSGPYQKGIQVNVLGVKDEFTELDLPAWSPVPVFTFPVLGPRPFGYGRGLTRHLRNLSPDIMHVHGLWQFPSLVALQWHQVSRKPYVVSPHGMLDPWAFTNARLRKQLAWFAYERRHLSHAACIRALCVSEAESIRALGIRTPICILPNGVDLPTSNRCNLALKATEPSEALRTRKLLLFLGRIHQKKGLIPLLRAWAQVRQKRGAWTLVIAGWDQNRHTLELKRLANELNLDWTDAPNEALADASVVFLGPQFGTAKQQWLERCQALILPSFSEGLPMAVLEAWAFAKPVLISSQCHLPEGLVAGAAIALEPTQTSIAVALEELFAMGPATLGCMGKCGQALVADKFAWPKIAAELKRVYLWILGSGPKPACILDQ